MLTRSVYESVQVGFFDSGDRYFSTSLYCCADEKPPKTQTSSESFLSIPLPLRKLIRYRRPSAVQCELHCLLHKTLDGDII